MTCMRPNKDGRGTVFQDLDDIYATPLNTGDGTNIHCRLPVAIISQTRFSTAPHRSVTLTDESQSPCRDLPCVGLGMKSEHYHLGPT
jgi:hypothetical protein